MTQTSGYMRMRGSEYIRMKAAAAQEDSDNSMQVPISMAYADIPHRRQHESDIVARPMQRLQPSDHDESMELDVVVPSPSLMGGAEAVATEAKPVTDSSENDGEQSGSEEAEDQASPLDPFIPKMTHLNGGGVHLRNKKGCKSNDSVVSETSSGFHSDYIPEDNNSMPPNYEAVIASNMNESVV